MSLLTSAGGHVRLKAPSWPCWLGDESYHPEAVSFICADVLGALCLDVNPQTPGHVLHLASLYCTGTLEQDKRAVLE